MADLARMRLSGEDDPVIEQPTYRDTMKMIATSRRHDLGNYLRGIALPDTWALGLAGYVTHYDLWLQFGGVRGDLKYVYFNLWREPGELFIATLWSDDGLLDLPDPDKQHWMDYRWALAEEWLGPVYGRMLEMEAASVE